jgi:hypothetical protein
MEKERENPANIRPDFRESIQKGEKFKPPKEKGEKKQRFKDQGKDNLEKEKARGNIERIRTIKPTKETYIHVGVRKHGKGKRGGKTIAGKLHHKKKK